MTEPQRSSNALEQPHHREPSPELDARIQRLAHAALRASRSSAEMTRLERSLSYALVLSYAAYVVTQVVVIFQRG
jgi:hypothetical protein